MLEERLWPKTSAAGQSLDTRTWPGGCHTAHMAIAMRAIGLSVVMVVALTGTATGTSQRTATGARVVLGSTSSFVPGGKGWGTATPALVYNGGDPSGRAWQIHWQKWGKAVAAGEGLTYLSPTLTHGWRTGRIQLRASRIGHCSPNGPRAYTRLEVRVAPFAGGRFSGWSLWNGRSNLCAPSG